MIDAIRRFLSLLLTANEAVVTGYRQPLGYVQIVNATIASTAAGFTLPTIPAGATIGLSVIQSNGGDVRWRDDGTAPTTALGMILPDGGQIEYVGDPKAIQFIQLAGTPLIDASFYR